MTYKELWNVLDLYKVSPVESYTYMRGNNEKVPQIFINHMLSEGFEKVRKQQMEVNLNLEKQHD